MSDIIDNRAHHRFELDVDGHVAMSFYKLADGVITFVHTEVPPGGFWLHLQSWLQ